MRIRVAATVLFVLMGMIGVAPPAAAAEHDLGLRHRVWLDSSGALHVGVRAACYDAGGGYSSVSVTVAQPTGARGVVRGKAEASVDCTRSAWVRVAVRPSSPDTAGFRVGRIVVVATGYECWRSGDDWACAGLEPVWAAVWVAQADSVSSLSAGTGRAAPRTVEPSTAAAATADGGEPAVTVRAKPTGRLLVKGAAAVVRMELVCDPGSHAGGYLADVRVVLRQRTAAGVVSGTIATPAWSIPCDGQPHGYSLPVVPGGSLRWVAGAATVTVAATERLYGPDGEAAAGTTARIRLAL